MNLLDEDIWIVDWKTSVQIKFVTACFAYEGFMRME